MTLLSYGNISCVPPSTSCQNVDSKPKLKASVFFGGQVLSLDHDAFFNIKNFEIKRFSTIIAGCKLHRNLGNCPRGGIGRRAWFRSMCRKVWGFESLRGHHRLKQQTYQSTIIIFTLFNTATHYKILEIGL